MEHWNEHEKLEKDPFASERTCAHETCACVIRKDAPSDYCSEYCSDEGSSSGEGQCQCGHIPCA